MSFLVKNTPYEITRPTSSGHFIHRDIVGFVSAQFHIAFFNYFVIPRSQPINDARHRGANIQHARRGKTTSESVIDPRGHDELRYVLRDYAEHDQPRDSAVAANAIPPARPADGRECRPRGEEQAQDAE